MKVSRALFNPCKTSVLLLKRLFLKHLVDETILSSHGGGHVVVPVRITLNFLNRLSGVKGDYLVEALFQLIHELDGALDIGSCSLGAAGDLMDHNV